MNYSGKTRNSTTIFCSPVHDTRFHLYGALICQHRPFASVEQRVLFQCSHLLTGVNITVLSLKNISIVTLHHPANLSICCKRQQATITSLNTNVPIKKTAMTKITNKETKLWRFTSLTGHQPICGGVQQEKHSSNICESSSIHNNLLSALH